MKYFQCPMCKILKEVEDTLFETIEVAQDGGGVNKITDVKPESIESIMCRANDKCNRRMRELTEEQFNAETIQRKWLLDNGYLNK